MFKINLLNNFYFTTEFSHLVKARFLNIWGCGGETSAFPPLSEVVSTKHIFASMSYFYFALVVVTTHLAAQRTDFYDPYDYDLRNQKIKTLEEERFQMYNLPPKRPARPNLNPKRVQKDLDIGLIIPQNTPFRTAPQTQNFNNSPINIFTGELNVEQILRNEEERRKKNETQLKKLENFEKPVYSETKFRRGEVIFFMTFPFALGATAILASAINSYQSGFLRTPQATLLIGVGSIGLSLGNVYLDALRYEEFMKERLKNPSLNKTLEFYLSIGQFRF